jgi:hypothetical protein
LPGNPGGWAGKVKVPVSWTRLFCVRLVTFEGKARVATCTRLRECGPGERKTATVGGGIASAWLTAPGSSIKGSMSVLAPRFWTSTVVVKGPPHDATFEVYPETVRSGSENPSGV